LTSFSSSAEISAYMSLRISAMAVCSDSVGHLKRQVLSVGN
jgi:hypothetical protein